MSNNGQQVFSANELISLSPNRMIVRTFELQKDEHDEPHSHPWHQVLFPRSGMLRTRTTGKVYFVPPNRAAVIPAGTVHESWALTHAEFTGIYLDPDLFPAPITQCRIIEVTGFLGALMKEVLEPGRQSSMAHTPEHKRLISVLVDQIDHSPKINLSVTLPDEKRLLPIVQDLLTDPGSCKSLADWSNTVGASERTLSRQFRKLTGLSFARWRQKVRMISALSMLEEGQSIQEIAHHVGYSSASAFIFRFKSEFGTTPQKYHLQDQAS